MGYRKQNLSREIANEVGVNKNLPSHENSGAIEDSEAVAPSRCRNYEINVSGKKPKLNDLVRKTGIRWRG
jgi:hypothetical protein